MGPLALERFADQLESIVTDQQQSRVDNWQWLADSKLTHLALHDVQIQNMESTLLRAPLLSRLSLRIYRDGADDEIEALKRFLRADAARRSPCLRELALTGGDWPIDLACLQGLRLTKLSLTSDRDDFDELPCADMPLLELSLAGSTGLKRLPLWFSQSMTSLRFLDLTTTDISLPFDGPRESTDSDDSSWSSDESS